jgi:hypothetical protein
MNEEPVVISFTLNQTSLATLSELPKYLKFIFKVESTNPKAKSVAQFLLPPTHPLTTFCVLFIF